MIEPYKLFLLNLLLLSLVACTRNKVQINYINSLKNYPIDLTSHFPTNPPHNGVSANLLPAGAPYIHYWGFQLLINYNNEEEKEEYLKSISNKVIDTITITDTSSIFLTTIKNYCNISNEDYKIYPLPNIKDQINIANYEVFNNTIKYSEDWSNYKFLLIEQKDTIIYEEQKMNSCFLLESILNHGFSRGVVVNEKDHILFYWLYFW